MMTLFKNYTLDQKEIFKSALGYFERNADSWTLGNYVLHVIELSDNSYKLIAEEFYQFSLSKCLLDSEIDLNTFNKKCVELVVTIY